MKWLGLVILLFTANVGSTGIAHSKSKPDILFPDDLDMRHNLEIHTRVYARADPREDAALAASKNDFGLIAAGRDVTTPRPYGVTCSTHDGRAPVIRAWFVHSDFIDEETGRLLQYASAYNRAVVSNPLYPHRKLCKPS